MKYDQLTSECAAEIAFTYPHAKEYPNEVVGEWLDCGEPLNIDFWELCNAVTECFKVMTKLGNTTQKYQKAIDILAGNYKLEA